MKAINRIECSKFVSIVRVDHVLIVSLHVISTLLLCEGHEHLLRHMIVLSMEVFCHYFFIQVSFLREVSMSTQKARA